MSEDTAFMHEVFDWIKILSSVIMIIDFVTGMILFFIKLMVHENLYPAYVTACTSMTLIALASVDMIFIMVKRKLSMK